MIKNLFIILAVYTAALNSVAQKNSSCNFKKLSKLILKIDPKNSKSELDKTFGVEGILSGDSGKSDSTVKIYNYQFCDDKIEHTYTAAFLKNKLVYILKSFQGITDCGKEEDFQIALNKKYTVEDVNKIFGVEGDIKMIYWDPITSIEIQKEYVWRCCNSSTYFTIVFKNGELVSCNRFPQKPSYGRPIKDKK
jgi:hypothetical protein